MKTFLMMAVIGSAAAMVLLFVMAAWNGFGGPAAAVPYRGKRRWQSGAMNRMRDALTVGGRIARRARRGELVYLANIAEGTHENSRITYFADAAVATRFLLAKRGSAADRVAICTGADVPIGVMTDEAAAAGDPMNVQLLGGCPGTVKMIASAAIAQDALLEPAAGGKVVTLGAGAGTHHVVGRALTAAAADGDEVEVAPSYFLRVI